MLDSQSDHVTIGHESFEWTSDVTGCSWEQLRLCYDSKCDNEVEDSSVTSAVNNLVVPKTNPLAINFETNSAN